MTRLYSVILFPLFLVLVVICWVAPITREWED